MPDECRGNKLQWEGNTLNGFPICLSEANRIQKPITSQAEVYGSDLLEAQVQYLGIPHTKIKEHVELYPSRLNKSNKASDVNSI